MKFEKFVNSGFFHFFEILYQIILFNLLFILSLIVGLGLFSYMIGLVVLVLAIKSVGTNRTTFIVKTWISTIRKYYKKAFIISLFYTASILFFLFDSVYFYLAMQTNPLFFYQISFFIFLVLSLVVIVACVNAAFVFVYFPNLSKKKTILYSFKLIQLIPLQIVGLMTSFILTIALMYVAPFIVLFFWISLSLYLFNLSIRKFYSRIVADGVTSLSFDDIE